jgi:Carboxypeptidase regulatory-like domain
MPLKLNSMRGIFATTNQSGELRRVTPRLGGSMGIKWSRIVLLALLGAGANLSVGQGFSLSGTVRDQNRKPLANVAVELGTRSQGRRITGTDENGSFVFTDLSPGSYQVSFELAGYVTVVRTVAVKFDKDPKDDSKDDDKGSEVILVPEKERAKKR